MLERNPRFYCQRSADERAPPAATGRLFRQPGVGTPLCAVLDAADLDALRMQCLAAWLNLSETVFFLPPGAGADDRIRLFNPRANCRSQATPASVRPARPPNSAWPSPATAC